MLTKWLEKKLDGNYTRMLRAILNRFWQQHPTRHQLYGHLPPITKTVQARRIRHVGHCWRSKDEIVSDVLLWTPAYGQSKAGRPVRTFIQQLCDDTGCNPEDQPKVMNDRETWRESVRDIRASRTWWWWWLLDKFSFKWCQIFTSAETTRNSIVYVLSIGLFNYRNNHHREKMYLIIWHRVIFTLTVKIRLHLNENTSTYYIRRWYQVF